MGTLRSRYATVSRLLRTDVRDLFKTGRVVDDELLGGVQHALDAAELDRTTADDVLQEIAKQRGRVLSRDDVLSLIRSEIARHLERHIET